MPRAARARTQGIRGPSSGDACERDPPRPAARGPRDPAGPPGSPLPDLSGGIAAPPGAPSASSAPPPPSPLPTLPGFPLLPRPPACPALLRSPSSAPPPPHLGPARAFFGCPPLKQPLSVAGRGRVRALAEKARGRCRAARPRSGSSPSRGGTLLCLLESCSPPSARRRPSSASALARRATRSPRSLPRAWWRSPAERRKSRVVDSPSSGRALFTRPREYPLSLSL